MNHNKHAWFAMLYAIIGFALIISGSSYAMIITNNNNFNDHDLIITYEDYSGDILKLLENYPIEDEVALKRDPYIISVQNNGNDTKKYKLLLKNDKGIINLDNCQENLLSDEYVKISINNSNPRILTSLQDYEIDNGILEPNQSEKYSIRLWISSNSDNSVLGKHFHKQIIVEPK